MKDTQGPYTPEEVREKMLSHMRMLCKYWSSESRMRNEEERMEGLCHSLLCMFDGCTMGLPAMDIIPSPHKDDKKFYIENGEKWYKKEVINNCQLHELWYKKK